MLDNRKQLVHVKRIFHLPHSTFLSKSFRGDRTQFSEVQPESFDLTVNDPVAGFTPSSHYVISRVYYRVQ